MESKTSGVGRKDWIEATKGVALTAYVLNSAPNSEVSTASQLRTQDFQVTLYRAGWTQMRLPLAGLADTSHRLLAAD